MSVKIEYDLNSICGPNDAGEENSFQIENSDTSTAIDIKFEFPHQPDITFQVDKQHEENSIETLDPLESEEDGFICTKCNKGFPSPFLFEQHMIQIHQDERPYTCKHCDKSFATPTQQKRHERIHDPKRFEGEAKFLCDICGKSYHLKRSLEGHKFKTHKGYKPSTTPVIEPSGSKNSNASRKPKEFHPCPYCDLTFEMKHLVQKHMIVHTKERPFSCPICQESFPRRMTMKNHIRNIHQASTTPTGRCQIRPKWQANDPCPCTICGKVYRIPNQLAKHMRIHTGEKPHSCETCNRKFRTTSGLSHHIKQSHLKTQLLSNPLKLFKCRVCGKNDFVFFRDLRQHRYGVHRNIAYESEKEKPFACGICGKPYFLREGALICAVLGHDSSKLRMKMFKVRCPECPEGEVFGYHNVLALRRHWGGEHGDKTLPARFRVGMHGDKVLKDELPTCSVDKVKAEDIKMNGVNLGEIESDGLMYTELDLLEIPEEERFFRRIKKEGKKREKIKREYICTICGKKLSSGRWLKSHVKVMHDPKKVENNLVKAKLKDEMRTRKEELRRLGYSKGECKTCGKKFGKMSTLRKHERVIHLRKRTRNKIGRPKKKFLEVIKKPSKYDKMGYYVAGDGQVKRRVGRPRKIVLKMEHRDAEDLTGNEILEDNGFVFKTVNISEHDQVQAILSFQTVTVNLNRLDV